MNKEYNLAVAFLQFRVAYSNLVATSKQLPKLDLSDNYPFFLLDFEEIAPAVQQWCVVHSTRLMQQLPERVDNPVCLSCKYLRSGLTKQGLCIGFEEMQCGVHPEIVFSVEGVRPYLLGKNINLSNLSADEIHLLYIKQTEEAYENKLD